MTAPTRESTTGDILHALIGAFVVCALLSVLNSCSVFPKDSGDGEAAKIKPRTDIVSFQDSIKPLFEGTCLHCHNGHVAAGDLDLRTKALAFRRSSFGPFIVPGHPERSKLFNMVRVAGSHPGAMPPTGHGLSEDEIALLKGWIAQGASWPEDASGHLKAAPRMDWRSR